MERQRPITFIGSTSAGGETVVTHEFDESAVLTGAHVTTHSGQEYGLRNFAEIIREGSSVSLWRSLGEDYLAGDGENYDLPIRFSVEDGDVLKLKADNVAGFDYDHNVVIDVDYATGLRGRITSALAGAI